MPRPKLPGRVPSLPEIPTRLNLACLLAWWAFEMSTARAIPISPSDRLTARLFRDLEEAQVFFAVNERRKDARRSLRGHWAWQYPNTGGATGPQLCAALQRSVTSYRSRTSWRIEVMALWQVLVDAESFEYLIYLLANHQLDLPLDLSNSDALGDVWCSHSLGRRRYLAWYAVRGASAALLRSGMNQAVAGRALCEELRRRSRWLHSDENADGQQMTNFTFASRVDHARTLIVQLFLKFLAPIGDVYWSCPPKIELLDLRDQVKSEEELNDRTSD